jgi:YVTN family beta-propeller protein
MYRRVQILIGIGLLALNSWLFTACRGDEIVYPTIGTHVTDEVRKGGLYVLCEGNMGSNKARLDYMNLEKGEYYANWYGSQNPHQLKELGDVGNDIQQYGGRLYAVINCSHKVEVMDLQARHIAKIDIPNCRYLAFRGSKMYVSAYVGTVANPELLGSVFEVDTASLQITREVKVGHQPDELCVMGDKLYVVNSGGYLTNRYDSTISVIDLQSFTEIRKINVGLNPTRIRMDDYQRLWVACQGNYGSVKPQLVVLENEEISHRIPTPCANLSILGSTVYIINNETNTIQSINSQLSIINYQLSTPFEHPYGLLATEDALYVSDAKNYVSSGILYCFDYSGHERWRARTGDIPGHLCRVSDAYDLYPDTLSPQPPTSSPYIAHVYEYVPAMGQFVNELPKYEEGDDAEAMCRKCELAIANNAGGMVCLGGWGGYITFGFDHAVENKEGRDIQILGNAYYMTGSTVYGSSEPGIVLVSRDENKNGKPDDTWYELKGCLYDDPQTNHAFSKTYTRAGDTIQNPFHKQPYYPQWLAEDEYTLYGAKLPSQTEKISGQVVQRILDYGYVDNKPNTDIDGTSFDISWAVDASGQSVSLPTIDFVRVYTAVDEINDPTGEISTELTGAIDLHVE